MIYSLDTNILVALLRSRDEILSRKFLSKRPCDYCVSEIVRAELLFGAEKSDRPDENRHAVDQLLAPLRLIPFEGNTALHYAEIRTHLENAGSAIGSNDLLIAATARSHGHTLVTRNTSEFLRVPALAVEKW